MKRYLLLLLIAAVSCTEVSFPERVGPEKVMILNAQMTTADTLHSIHLAYSTFGGIEAADDAVISCYVNGALAARTDTVAGHASFRNGDWETSEYHILAHFAPGDKVRLAGESRGFRVEAEVTVPDAPVVDAGRFESAGERTAGEGTYRFQCRVHDIPGQQNGYRAEMRYAQRIYEEDSGMLVGESAGEVRDADNSSDPLLYSGLDMSFGNPGRAPDETDYFANVWNLFTDRTFADGSCTLTFVAGKSTFLTPHGVIWEKDKYYVNDSEAIVRIHSLSPLHYRYVSAYRTLSAHLEPFRLISEDTAFPENVEGGMGFVSISAVTDCVIGLGPYRFTGWSYLEDI